MFDDDAADVDAVCRIYPLQGGSSWSLFEAIKVAGVKGSRRRYC